MTATECARALQHGLRHVWALAGLSLRARLLLSLAKAIAILGYNWGKTQWLREEDSSLRSSKPPAEAEYCTEAGLPAGGASPAGNSLALTPAKGACEAAVPNGSLASAAFPPMGKTASLGAAAATAAGRVAVVVPAYLANPVAAANLRQLLDGLLSQKVAPGAVILVDDCSPYDTCAEVADEVWALARSSSTYGAAGGPPPALATLRLPRNAGPATARNTGVAAALGLGAAVISLIDADCVPDPGWTAAMLAAQRARPGIVCGRTFASRPAALLGLYHNTFGTLNGRRLPDGSLLYGCTCNMSLSAATASTLRFDTDFPTSSFEDVELCVRARKQGVPLAFAPGAVVRHAYDYRLAGLFWQFCKYGRYERLMVRKHPEYLGLLHASADIPC